VRISTGSSRFTLAEDFTPPRFKPFNPEELMSALGGNLTLGGALWRTTVGTVQRMQEADMTGILDKFHVEHGIHGAKVMTRSNQITGDCISDGEIDSAVQMLKDDLDACAREMKRLLEVNRRGSMFEGWPSANEDILNA
jgi:hypothetical protein